MTTKILLIENFLWLVQQLSAFEDPKFTYKDAGLPTIKGGQRRIYRYGAHYQQYYQGATIKKSPPEVKVLFGQTEILCDKWDVSHPEFSDANLKEKNPKPSDVNAKFSGSGSNHYSVLVTSKKSFENGTARRYYVSCSCPDFETTFKEELIQYGYTNGMVPAGKGVKKLAPAICKHIYAVIYTEYKDIITSEDRAEESAEISLLDPGTNTIPTDIITPPPAPKKDKKAEYEALIRKSLKFFSNNMRDAVDSYHDTRQTSVAYKKYKFMIKKYFQGYVIVFTNPQLNPMRDKVREKEVVPILNRTARGMFPAADSVVVYTKYFTKDELMGMIKAESRPIQPNQITRLDTLFNKKYTLTEALEVSEESSVRNLLLEIC